MEKIVYREWCKHCNDWKLFDLVPGEGMDRLSIPATQKHNFLICSICGNKIQSYNVNEIPNDKKLEQRTRYKRNRVDVLKYIYGASQGNMFSELFSEPSIKTVVVEADAGLASEERQARLASEERHRKFLEEQKSLTAIYRYCRRNDICPCGSGKKFKKCHLPVCEKYGVKHD